MTSLAQVTGHGNTSAVASNSLFHCQGYRKEKVAPGREVHGIQKSDRFHCSPGPWISALFRFGAGDGVLFFASTQTHVAKQRGWSWVGFMSFPDLCCVF